LGAHSSLPTVYNREFFLIVKDQEFKSVTEEGRLKENRPLETKDMPGATLFLQKQAATLLLLLLFLYSHSPQEANCNHSMGPNAILAYERDSVPS